MGRPHAILFALGGFGVGGVERVTTVLARSLRDRGQQVGISCFRVNDETLLNGLDGVRVLRLSGWPWFGLRNLVALRRYLRSTGTDVIVSQWCHKATFALFLRVAKFGLGVRLITAQHGQPGNSNRMGAYHGILRRLCGWVTALNLRAVYFLSDKYVVLSPSFIRAFREFVGVGESRKLIAISNPITLSSDAREPKSKLIIYVGRLEEIQKRVSRIIQLWKLVADRLPDYEFKIVGDGPDMKNYQEMARGIARLSFEGYQDPSGYYARAEAIVLTSDREGFGLVLVEAMACGCVPVALNSYLSLEDIVRDGEDGEVVPMPWSVERFGDRLVSLLSDRARYQRLSERARCKARTFSLSEITQRWIKEFDDE